MQRPEDLPPGAVLGGCRIEGLLGRGGMGVVYKARQLSLDRTVALKALPTHFAHNKQFVERFNREASALARLSHPNIVGILDKGVEGETYYFVMEHVEGRSLRDRLLRERQLSPQETIELTQGICAALEYAHEKNIVHRDLKPGNILLDADGTPKLADFGIARIIGTATGVSEQLTMAHTTMGSADYMAPEQRHDAASADHRADIYALGVMVYQMLTGQLPVGTFKPVSRLVAGLSTGFDRVIRAALAPSPKDRFDSVAKFRAALNQAFAESATRTQYRAATGARRRSSWVLGAFVAAGVVVALGVVALIMASRHRETQEEMPSKPPTPPLEVVTPPEPPPEPGEEPPRPPPKPKGEPGFVREALAEVRQYIADHPNDYRGQIERLNQVILTQNDARIAQVARKERDAVIGSLNQAVADHFATVKEQADAFVAKRRVTTALKILAELPAFISTVEARKQQVQLLEHYRGKARAIFAKDKGRVTALLEAAKPEEAAAILRGADYGLPEVNTQAAAELATIQQTIAALEAKARAELVPQLQALWAERQYSKALAVTKNVLAKAPNRASRKALQAHLRAATLLSGFWQAVQDGARSLKGQAFRIKGVNYKVLGLDGHNLVLALGGGKTKRDLRKLSPSELAALARSRLDLKKADANLMLGLLYTYDRKPNPALAKKAFDKAMASGATRRLVAAFRNLSKAAQPPAPKPPRPQGATAIGFALDFNGASDYVEVPDDTRRRSLRLKSFTVEAWVWRRPGLGQQCVMAKNAGWTDSASFTIYVQAGRWAYATGNGIDTDFRVTRQPAPAGRWLHFALVYHERQRAFFINGKLADKSRTRRLSYDDQPLTIGARSLDGDIASFWNGAIDEVRISRGPRYRKDFTPERHFKPDPHTHLLLRFDEGKGERASDVSPFKNHGAIRGARFVPPNELKLPKPQPPKPQPPKQPPAPPRPAKKK